jgi:hypothetical protein
MLLQGLMPCSNSFHSNNINNNTIKDPQVKSPFVPPATHQFFNDVKNGVHDGAQSHKTNTPGNGNVNSNTMECGQFYSKISLQREYSLATDVDYISCSRKVSESKSLIQCVKSRDLHLYNRISTEKTYDHTHHSFKRPAVEICGSFRDNFINNNTTTFITPNKHDISNNINSISGIKRNCGRILPIPSSSTRPLSIKLPFHMSKTDKHRNSFSLKDTKVTNSQARPVSFVLPTASYNINHSLKTLPPSQESSHSIKLVPSPKIHPTKNTYQRLRYSTNENVHLLKKQTDELNNNSNVASLANDKYISTSVDSPCTSNLNCDRENNNIHTSSVSLLSKLKARPMSLLGNPLQIQSRFNSSNLVNRQKYAYPNTVLCTGQNSTEINPNYPNCTNATNVSTTIIPSTHSSTTTTPSSSSSIVNSSPEQPSVLLVVYPVPFVHEAKDVMEQQQCDTGNSEEMVRSTCQQSTKQSSRCGIQ